MAVQEQTPLREYTANGVTTSFALGFDCEETNHLIVTIDDVEVLPTDWYLSGSNVVFWTAPGNGKLIKLQRNTPFNRLADYQSYNNSFRPPAINKDFDRIWWKLQELGVADWILHNRIDALKAYVDQQDSELQQNIDNLKIYVDDKDDELRAYLLEEIRKQGVALDQLDDYYNYLMQRLAQIAVDRGWDASFVVDASGLNQQQINDLMLTPFQFGAVGDGTSHKLSERYSTLADAQSIYPIATSLDDEIDWCALQSMLNHALSQGFNRKTTVDWSGNFHLNKGIKYLAPTDESGAWRSINGDLRFTVRDDFDQSYEAVISLAGRGVNQQGVVQGNCRGIVKYGLVTVPSSEPYRIDFGIKVDRIFIDDAAIFAVVLNHGSMFGTLNLFRGGGSGIGLGSVAKKLTSNFSNKVDTDVGGIASSSTMSVDVLPRCSLTESPVFVVVDGYLSQVTEINTATKTLKIVPHIPSGEVGSLNYIYGGAVWINGSNTAGFTIGGLSAIGCGIGFCHENMYPTTVSSLETEFCGIAIYESGLVGGANILTHYIEGDIYEYVNNAENPNTFGSTSFTHGLHLDFSKFVYLRFGRNADGGQIASFAGARGLSIRTSKYTHKLDDGKFPENYYSSCVIDFNAPHTLLSYKGDIATVTFADISPDSNRLFGYDTQDIQFFGTAQNAAPQQITFSVLAGYKLNGGTSDLVFNTFSAVAKFSCFLDVVNKNIIVSAITEVGKDYSTSGLYPYNSLGATLDTGYWYINDYNQISGTPTPTSVTQKCAFKQFLSSGSRVSGNFILTQEVYFVEIGEKWTRTFNQSTGVMSEWVLVNYRVKKGTTALRPSNPHIGMRYYDTTLLGTGKPIEYNGTAWVDMTGAVV